MISAVWIAKNEGAKIGRSIDSVKAVADELIVVDTGSTDDTIEVAKQHGARVEHFTWVNDFAAARNYALNLAKGDALIVLDADEWFEPALGKNFVKAIDEVFLPGGHATLLFELVNIDPDYGMELSRMTTNRVLNRNCFKNGVYYTGAIHETLVLPMDKRGSIKSKEEIVLHDGYGLEASKKKSERNTELLLQSFASAEEGSDKKVKLGIYLAREYTQIDLQKATQYAQWCLNYPAQLMSALKYSEDLIGPFAIICVDLLANARTATSRQQIKNVVLPIIKKLAPQWALTAIIDEVYTAYFDFKAVEQAYALFHLLQKTEAERKLDDTHAKDYYDSAQMLCAAAGRTFYRLGERPKMFELLAHALSYPSLSMGGELISQFLLSVKGLPLQDIILFLNSKIDLTVRSNLDLLCGACQYEGNKQLYLYYSLKAIEGSMATRADYCYFLIVSGKEEEAINTALELPEGLEEGDLPKVLFLALACAQSEALLNKYAGQTGPYEELLNALFKGVAPSAQSYGLAKNNYFMLAFAAGLPQANRLLDVYPQNARENFLTRLGYYYYSGQSAEFLEEYPYSPAIGDLPAILSLADVYCVAGRYNDAWKWLKTGFAANGPSPDWFNLAAVVAQKAKGEIKTEAEPYCKQYLPLYEECVDLHDIANTGREMQRESKKQRKKLSDLPVGILQKWLGDGGEPPFVNQLSIYQKAAAVLERAGNIAEAARLYIRVLAHPNRVFAYGPAQKLQDWFLELGNKEAAALMAILAQKAEQEGAKALAAQLEKLEDQSFETLLEGQKRALAALPPEELQMVEQALAKALGNNKLCWKDSQFALLEQRAKALSENRGELRWLAERLEGPTSCQVLAAVLKNWQTLSPAALYMAQETWQPGYGNFGKVLEMLPEKLEEEALRQKVEAYKPALALPLHQSPADLWRLPRLLDDICKGYIYHLVYFENRWAPCVLALVAQHPQAAENWERENWPEGALNDYIAPRFGEVTL